MKFNKLMFLVFIALVHFNSVAQGVTMHSATSNSLEFPYSGTYNLDQDGQGSPKDFNQVYIYGDVFVLRMNGTDVRHYIIKSEIKGGFHVEQIFPENESSTSEKQSFYVRIFSATENEYSIEINYPQGSEKLHLIK